VRVLDPLGQSRKPAPGRMVINNKVQRGWVLGRIQERQIEYTTVPCGLHGFGSPYRFQPRRTKNKKMAAVPIPSSHFLLLPAPNPGW